MRFVTTIFLSLIVAAFLSACASGSGLPAPCDNYATFCGTKTKINQW